MIEIEEGRGSGEINPGRGGKWREEAGFNGNTVYPPGHGAMPE